MNPSFPGSILNFIRAFLVLYNDTSDMRIFDFSLTILPNPRIKEEEWTFPNLTTRWTGGVS